MDYNNKPDAKPQASIDPQLIMSVPSSPGSDLSHLNGQIQHNHSEDEGLDKLFCTDTLESPESQPPDFFDLSRQSYYNDFGQAMESSVYYTTPVLNNFRRSISEPPTGSPHGLPNTLDTPVQHGVTFHRDSQYLGQPMGESAFKLRSMPKAKQHRQHPYIRKAQQSYKVKQSNQLVQSSSQPLQHHWQPPTSHVQRKVSRPPTSAPVFAASNSIGTHRPQQYPLVSSRICSPLPRSPAHVDDALDHTLRALGPKQPHHPLNLLDAPMERVVNIQISIGQLQEIVTKAVRDAIEAEKRTPTIATSGNLAAEYHSDGIIDRKADDAGQ